jgi:CRP-like cAMP-binding protein
MPQSGQNTLKNRLLSALPQEDFRHSFSDLLLVPLEIRHVIYEVGARFDFVYFIEGGLASVLTTMTDGSAIEVGMIGIEGMVGVSCLLGAEVAAQQIICQIPGTALRMNAVACKTAFDQSASVRKVVHRFAESFLNLGAQTAACNRLHSIEQRCARWLLMSSDRIQSDIMPMTQEFLSSMIGVRRASVTEVAGELQRSGLIRYHHGQITITDHRGLEETACECYRMDHDRFSRLM